MKISKITIDNFRSIKHIEIEVNNFNIFVGQNNHGKTNFFDAIDWFYSGKGDLEKISFQRDSSLQVTVEIEFSDIQEGIDKMKHEKHQTALKNLLGDSDRIRVKRTSEAPKVRQIFDQNKNSWLEKNATGFDSAFNDFLPKLEYVNTTMNPLDMIRYGKNTPIANMLSGVLTAILEDNPRYANFRAEFDNLFAAPDSEVRLKLDELSGEVKIHLEKQFEDCTEVVFEITAPIFEDLLKNFETSIDDGVYTTAEEKGDGMQRALMLAIIQAYADFRRKNQDTSKFFLFFIDEAELHLHPSAQRKLKNVLLELSEKGDQVFISTHSSVLVSEDHQNQSIFKVEKSNKETSILFVDPNKKPDIVYELLGGSPADLLLPRNFLIVEGNSELIFLRKIIDRHYTDKPIIQIIPAEGDLSQIRRSLNAIEQVFKPIEKSIYKDRVVIIVDKHEENQRNAFEKKYPDLFKNNSNQYFELNVGSIEEYYSTSWKKTEDQIKNLPSGGKIDLAKDAGENMSKEDFEAEMILFKSALDSCWQKCFD